MKKLISIIILFFALSGISQTAKTNVTAQEFKKLIEEKKFVLIDLRTDDEIKIKGKIKGATQINFLDKTAEEQINKLDKQKGYLIYCAGGGRSADCADLMEQQGFKTIINLEKGFSDWQKNGFEIEKIK